LRPTPPEGDPLGNAVVGIDVDDEALGSGNGMLMVAVSTDTSESWE
jgi:uncharacterized protein YbjQ (UPF0145 family)